MKVKHLLVGLCTALCGGIFVAPVFATTYSYDVDVQFNFNSKLAVTITDADIKILDLAPGTSADSNIVGITISTNNVAGYTAEATVGNAQNATTNMTHTNGTNTFASIATNASQATLTTDNTWGYAVSTDNGSSWSNFSGLPIYTSYGKELASTNSPAQDAIKFKINAKASTSQPAGDYTNVINFKVVANTPPRDWKDVLPPDYCTTHPTECDTETNLPKNQAINEDTCDTVETYDTQFQVTDSRDHKNYWISKLRDGNCWMTQNLDLDLDSTKTYTNADTDLGWNGTGYTTASWTPSSSTATFDKKGTSEWVSSYTEPFSIEPGDKYITPSADYSDDTVFTSLSDCMSNGTQNNTSDDLTESECQHHKIGNYYNWSAAIANNNSSSINTKYDNAESSICPSGWRLPYGIIDESQTKESVGDWNRMLVAEGVATGWAKTDTSISYTTDGFVNLVRSDPVYVVRAGYVSGGGDVYSLGGYGRYWSQTVYGSYDAYDLYLSNGSVMPSYSTDRNAHRSVRCIVRTKNPFTITFNANSGTGTMTSQQIKRGSSANISQNTFTRSGYFFNGWNTKADGTGVGYGDKELYTVASGSTENGVTLYAQWLQDSGGGSGGGGSYGGRTLQRAFEVAYNKNPGAFDMGGGQTKHGLYYPVGDGTYREATSEADYQRPANELRFAIQDIAMTFEEDGITYKVCDYATVIGSEALVLDLRDYKSYWIAKLKDGHCWMTQNLDLNLTNGTALTSTYSDVTTSWNPQFTTYTDYNTARGNWQNRYYQAYSYDPAEKYYYTDYGGNVTTYTSKADCANATGLDQQECLHYHAGNIYSMAAIAATNDIRNDYTAGTSTDLTQSICPAGWRLPTSLHQEGQSPIDTEESYQLLNAYNAIDTSTLTQSAQWTSATVDYTNGGYSIVIGKPLYFIRAGNINDQNNNNKASDYWTGTYYDPLRWNSYYSTYFETAGSVYYKGFPARCIAR